MKAERDRLAAEQAAQAPAERPEEITETAEASDMPEPAPHDEDPAQATDDNPLDFDSLTYDEESWAWSDIDSSRRFQIVGYDGPGYYVYHVRRKQILKIQLASLNTIPGRALLARPNWWERACTG